MPSLKLLSFCIILLSFSTCHEDEPMPQSNFPEYWGEITATTNGTPTQLDGYATSYSDNSYMRIVIDTINHGGVDGHIRFNFIPFDIDTYELSSDYNQSIPYATFFAANGDAVYAFYHLVEHDFLNFIEINSFDKTTKELKGNFEVCFAMDTVFLNQYPELSDTLRFTNGIFHTKLYEYE